MDPNVDYNSSLAEALAAKAENLERTAILRLREHLQGFEASVTAMYKFLIDKGLMQNDPYKHERTVTDIQVPSNEPYADSDALVEISMRFSHYVSQWEFMVNIFHVSVPNLSLRNVRKLLDLLDWIRWTDFSANSSLQITRAVAQIVGRVSQMNDPMAGKIMSSSAAHLRELTKSIRGELKTITAFLRERYKWRVREEVITGMNITPERYRRNPPDTLNNVKFEFSHRLKALGWYKELVQEVLEEDYGENADARREAVLDRLKVSEVKKKKKTRKGPDNLSVLLGIAERMGRAGEPIRSTMVKMNENSRTIQERKRSFGERLSEIISSMFHKTGNAVVYDVAIRDSLTGAVRHEALNFTKFSGIVMKRVRVLQELQDSNSATYKNARAAGAEALEAYIEKYLGEIKNIHRRLEGLDGYFQSKDVPLELRASMKSSNLNLKNLKNTIADTMRSMNEFRVRREEEEQLRKLGIDE